jgi:hypothetical protein
MSNKSEYIYNWWDEHGADPFLHYLENESERRELESKIQVAINLAIDRPSANPMEPNQPLIDFAKDLSARHEDTPGLIWAFYRIAGIPDPLDLERQRVEKRRQQHNEQRRRDAYNRLSLVEREEYDRKVSESVKTSHSGHWQYHDDDCLCWRYFEDSHCNRGGHTWSCCGSTTEYSNCYNINASVVETVPLPGYSEDDEGEEEIF